MISDDEYDAVVSPCIKICALDEQQVCMGCYRSIEEIGRWGRASQSQRREMLAQADARRNAVPGPAPKNL